MMNSGTGALGDNEGSIAEDSTSTEEAEANPFLGMPRSARLTILFLGGFYALLVGSMAIFNATEGFSMICVGLSSLWLIGWTLYPLLTYKRSYGWCHPLVLLALFGFANLVLRSTGLFISGLSDHIMLSDWSREDLNWLFAYGNFVNSLALMAIYFGFAQGSRNPTPSWTPTSVPPKRMYLVLLIFFVISLGALWSYTTVYG